MAIKTSLISLPLLFLVACAGDPTIGPGGMDDTPGGDDRPDAEARTQVAGTYEVTSSYDLTSSNALPPVVGEIIEPLSEFSDNPTGTIIDLIAVADTPITPLIENLSPTIRAILEATLNNLIEDKLYESVPVLEQITSYADLAATIVTDFDVVTTMQIGNVDDAGNANATHTLSGFSFEGLDGQRVFIDTPEIVDALVVARDVSVNVDLQGSTGTIDIGNHAMELPIGDFAVLGLNAAIQSQTDYNDLGDLLAGVIDCAGIAAEIGDVCVGSFCVLNESQLENFCGIGMNLVATQVENRLSNIGNAQLVMSGGQASITVGSKSDSTAGGAVNAMKAGSWDTEFGLGDHSYALQSEFEARRLD